MTFAQLQIGDTFTLQGNPYTYRKTKPVLCGLKRESTVNAVCVTSGHFVFVGDHEEVFPADGTSERQKGENHASQNQKG